MGSGKSTAAKILAEEFGFHLIKEKPQNNPFLKPFYQDMPRWALHVQLSYLFNKIKELEEEKINFETKNVIEDTPIEVSREIYAKAQVRFGNMTDKEHELYCDIYDSNRSHIPSPDLVIIIDAPADLIMRQINMRARGYESAVDKDYINTLISFQRRWMNSYPDDKKLIINKHNFDLKNKEGRQRFLGMVKDKISAMR